MRKTMLDAGIALPESTVRRQAIQIAQLELLIGNLPHILAANLIASFLVVIVASEGLVPVFRFGWFFWMAGLTLVRYRHLLSLREAPVTGVNVSQRYREFTLFSAIAAGSWSLFGFVAVTPESTAQSLTVIMLLTGMVASGTAFVPHLRQMYVTYIVLLMGPVALRCLSFGEREYIAFAALILLFLLMSWSISRATARAVMESIRDRFNNMDRYAELLEEKVLVDSARERAETASTEKSQFLSSASHDLRQPLHALRLFSANLNSRLRARSCSDEPGALEELAEDRRLVSRIDESVTALEGLFEGILDLSRLDAGTVDTRLDHVPLQRIFEHLELAHAPAATVKNLKFSHDAAMTVVHSDPVMLERLLTNLVSNAVRYTHQGHVHLSAETSGERVVIRVSDTGMGISEADRGRIFGEFVQLNNPERDRHQGVGLGLSIVRRLAVLLNIGVRVESAKQEQGSVFVVDVPAGDPSMIAAPPQVADQVTSNYLPNGLFVLIIDDEESARDAMEGLIHSWGGTVMLAASADEAQDALAEIDETPAIIVSDYRLRKGETGTQAIEQIRRSTSVDIPGLLITGDIDAHRLRDIKEAGLPVLHKPCRPEELRGVLSQLART